MNQKQLGYASIAAILSSLTVILSILKIDNIIYWNWFWVTFPLWLGIFLPFILLAIIWSSLMITDWMIKHFY